MEDDFEEAPPHPADPPQPLVDLVNAFSDPQAQGVFRDAAVKVQDYLVRRDVADQNSAMADRLVNNIDQFKSGLVSMVQSDPAATQLGLDLVPDIIGGIVASHPHLPEEQLGDIHGQLTGDIQKEIARAGVMSMADQNEAAARRLLDHSAVSAVLDDGDRTALNGYIGAQATARTADDAALARQRAVDLDRTRQFSTLNYFNALTDPATNDLTFPPGWAQKVTADPTLPPAYTAAMLNIYGRLRANGDAPASDPHLAADLIDTAARGGATTPGILQYAGNGMRLTDAVTIAGMAGPQTPEGSADIRALNDLVQQSRATLASPENGPAGQAAYERYMNWLLPAVRGGAVSVNPAEPTYAGLRLAEFAPRAGDMVGRAPSASRPSLDDILGPRRRPISQ